ncbi:L-2-hydroxyglutarate oxidase LhgO [Hartmannibacter diazotrophicus]|uniref:L-2-hydroxyglutarate oxidase LhgO n=1 Tax=Hartmannibacter diazotrophicus TaxID=1482074 RepID=A0A2C9DEF1_9HYPH|nr:NAD(P)/FAD-dependent oxidoreductase [Hartmannibacter diazotrophicus]SON58365.1 L-2-hydroxyglutarate oxidase LhgO [Hartmannibacter diazotrophicus]
METVDCLIIGAGVVGIAIARKLAQSGREVVVVEAEESFGTITSSRNSEVIHAGIYYPRDSQMARLCVAGRKALYAYCDAHQVSYQRCGKLIVATNEDEADRLSAIMAHAHANGASDVAMVDRGELARMEPALSAVAALHSPSTGILDSHGFMLSMLGEAEEAGAFFAFNAPFVEAEIGPKPVVRIGGREPMTLACNLLINAAGLQAPHVARQMKGFPQEHVPAAYYAKGSYFSLASGRAPFSRLIYPVPVAGGLGVHLTLDLAGLARFGPDIEWVEAIDYRVDPARGERFYAAVRRYWPGLPDGALVPAYSGIRPKIVPPSIARQDFVIASKRDHGIGPVIHLFGIESPGLTSSLAIADHVYALVRHA